jgi:hypothetical protein
VVNNACIHSCTHASKVVRSTLRRPFFMKFMTEKAFSCETLPYTISTCFGYSVALGALPGDDIELSDSLGKQTGQTGVDLGATSSLATHNSHLHIRYFQKLAIFVSLNGRYSGSFGCSSGS